MTAPERDRRDGGPGRLSAFAHQASRSTTGTVVVAVLLATAVIFEAVAVIGQLSVANAAILISGLFACACAVPVRRPRLVVRAAAAAAVSATCTLVMLAVRPNVHVWGAGEALALLVLMADVVRRAPKSTAIWLGGLLAVVAVTTPPRDSQAGPITAAVSALTIAVTVFFVYLRTLDADRDQAVEEAKAGERLELARELHDFVAHHVTGILIQAQTALAVPGDPAAQRTRLERIESAASQSLVAMRRVVSVLREAPTGTQPLAGLAEIEAICADARHAGLPVTLSIEPALRTTLAPNLTASAHRVVREALTNTRKHSPDATAADIGIRRANGGIVVEVQDHRPPRAHQASAQSPRRVPSSGFGLLGLTERATALGGTLQAGPTPDGWKITATFPESGDEL